MASIGDGQNVTQGAMADAAVTNPASDATVVALLKGILTQAAASLARVTASFTRPANTTAYTARDAVADSATAPTALTFADVVAFNGGSGEIVGGFIATNLASVTPRKRLHLYTSAPTAVNDNAQATAPVYSAFADYVGFMDFPGMQSPITGACSFAQWEGRLPFKCASGAAALYALVETLDAFNPSSGEQFSIALLVRRG